MKRKRAVLAGVGLGVLAATVAVAWASRSNSSRPDAQRPSPGVACRHGQARGYAMTGDVYEAVLRPIDLCPASLGAPILADAPTQRTSWLTGTADRAVVAEYGTGSDRIALVTHDGLVPVPGLGAQVGHSPALAPDGRLTYTDKQSDGKGGFSFTIVLFDPATGQRTPLVRRTVPPSNVAWGPDGRFAVVVDAGGADAHLLMFDRPGATPRRVTDLPRSAVSVMWPVSGDLIVLLAGESPEDARGVVLDPTTGRTRLDLDRAWRPVGTTRDGALVVVSASGEIARVAGPSYDAPEVFGTLPDSEPVWQVVL